MATRRQRRQTRMHRCSTPTERQPWVHNEIVRLRKEARRTTARATEAAAELRTFGLTAELAAATMGDCWFPYYNREGTRVCQREYLDLFEDPRYRQIGLDHHGETVISTVWLGIDHSFGMGARPLIFETMIFGGDHDGHLQRYTTEDAARCGHIEVMETLLATEGGCVQ